MGSVGTEEVLIGIFREGRNAAARLLSEGRFDMTSLRKGARTAGQGPCRRCGQVVSPAVVEPTFRIRLDVDERRTPPLVSVAAAVCAVCGLVEFVASDPSRLTDR